MKKKIPQTMSYDRDQRTTTLVCQIWPSSIFINKVLLEYNNIHSFMYCLWILSWHKSRADQLTQFKERPQRARSLKYLLSGHI